MKEDNTPQIVTDTQSGYLALPFNQEQFRDFVKSLLGTPQTITRRIRGNFEMQLKDLQNFHELIGQRITQQNNGNLLQLKTKIYYSDESSVTLSSYNELITYNEIKPIISLAVRMTWVYLIQFADKDIPEKQEIEIMIIALPLRSIISEDDLPVFFSGLGQFEITIKHTARSWGSDMESLISNQISSILIPVAGWKKIIRKNNTVIGFLTGVAFLLCSALGIYFATARFNSNEIERISKFLKKAVSVENEVNFTLRYIAENTQNFFFLKTQLFTTVSLFLAILLGAWVGNLANNEERSHLILTRESKRSRDSYIEKSKKKTMWFFISLFISVATGIISSYVFEWLAKL